MKVLLAIIALIGNLSGLTGVVKDKSTGLSLPSAPVIVEKQGRTVKWAVTDEDGKYKIDGVAPGTYDVNISYVGYKDFSMTVTLAAGMQTADFALTPDDMAIKEVVVTAVESRGLTSVTTIKEDAIEHIQPSSFADLLELLPGGIAQDPSLSTPNLINLRSANSLTDRDYATSALGTKFMIDGRPVQNDANLQSTPAYSGLGSSYVNYGTDMREITTEDIESVNIVRGIASVRYGDLTSGLINIKRKAGGRDLHARFKADMKSKLVYVGKGFEWGGRDDRLTMNTSLNFLDSKADPRETRQNWKRLTGSWRMGKTWNGDGYVKTLGGSFDYTGSFDNQKSDENLDKDDGGGPVETYRSVYNKFALSGNFSIRSGREESFFKEFSANASLTYERDLIDRWRHVTLGRISPVSNAMEEGPHDAVIVPARYDAALQVIGRPFYAHASANASFSKGINKIDVGADWNMDKNYGDGTKFDTSRPFSTSMSVRPRPYREIPATHQLSLYAEDNLAFPIGAFKVETVLGLRLDAMAGAGSRYDINMKPYLDPRGNFRLNFPAMLLDGYKLDMAVYGGAGKHTKFPTMDMLYPDPVYGDITQLSYWPADNNLRRINLYVYKIDPTNFKLSAASNTKWEIGYDVQWNGFSFSIDYFRENMDSGFRYGSDYRSVVYKRYDASGVDIGTLTGPPDIAELPSAADTMLTAYSVMSNGSRTLKRGIEFTFYSKRIKAINTKITANGAWFRTDYMNSVPEYYRPSVIIEGRMYPYIGLYDKNDGSYYESLTSNFMFDTQIPRLGLIFSTSFQCEWYSGHRTMPDSKYPVSYLDKKLVLHPFTEADADDAVLRSLVRDYTASLYQFMREPFRMNINLKVTKKLYRDKVSCSLYVNRIFDITPNYYRNGAIVRRNVVPYFGMELDFKI